MTLATPLVNELSNPRNDPKRWEYCFVCKNIPAVSAVCPMCQKKHIAGRVHSIAAGLKHGPVGLCKPCTLETMAANGH